MTERINASTGNQYVEIVLNFEFLISIKLYTVTLNITIIPPNNVSCEIVSFKNIQTQNGLNEISKSIKNVTSEA